MSTALGLVLGFCADRLVGDPARWHPVAGFGSVAAHLEQRTYVDRRAAGVAHVALLVGGAAAVGLAGERTRHPPRPVTHSTISAVCRGADDGSTGLAHTLLTAAATWAVLGGRSLEREATAVADLLYDESLPAARRRLTHLVGRTTSDLDESDVARAVIESVAENTSDAVVAPLVWGAIAGIPGLLGYRAANTLDAMVGHHSTRYERFGWAAARLDDLLNLPGARVSAALAVGLGDDPRAALRAWRRDAGAHPSPNAGPVEAAFAGALGLRLGGRTVYASRVEDRPLLGDGRAPVAADVTRATALARRVGWGALAACAVLALRRP